MTTLEQVRETLLERIDQYSSWLMRMEHDLSYSRMRGICELCYRWTVGAKSADTMEKLDTIDFTLNLSMLHVEAPGARPRSLWD